jgi:hypothetical protein
MNAVFWITALKAGTQVLKFVEWSMASGQLPTERAGVTAALAAFRAEQTRLASTFEQDLQAELDRREAKE